MPLMIPFLFNDILTRAVLQFLFCPSNLSRQPASPAFQLCCSSQPLPPTSLSCLSVVLQSPPTDRPYILSLPTSNTSTNLVSSYAKCVCYSVLISRGHHSVCLPLLKKARTVNFWTVEELCFSAAGLLLCGGLVMVGLGR